MLYYLHTVIPFGRLACCSNKVTKKIKSFRWNAYFIKESDIKNYKGISLSKTRPILVVSDNDKLINRSLIVELSTKKQNEHSIFWYKWSPKDAKNVRESWILQDRMHTINRWLLKDKYKLMNHKLQDDIKNKIISFCNEMINK
jgi:hypothetical protein